MRLMQIRRVGRLTWSVSSAASNGTAYRVVEHRLLLLLINRMQILMVLIASICRVSDGTLIDTITVNVTITAVNDAPVITQGAGPLTKTVAEDGLASWTPTELNATDADTEWVAYLECEFGRE